MFFFFQAEDGIRDKLVTGVQTCALPIYATSGRRGSAVSSGATAQWRATHASKLVRRGAAGRTASFRRQRRRLLGRAVRAVRRDRLAGGLSLALDGAAGVAAARRRAADVARNSGPGVGLFGIGVAGWSG